MSESNESTRRSTEGGAQQSSAPTTGEGFRQAEDLLTVDNEDSGARTRNVVASIENRKAVDEQTYDSDALKRRVKDDLRADDDSADATADEKLEEDLEEKALEESVNAANNTTRIEMDLTPHNI